MGEALVDSRLRWWQLPRNFRAGKPYRGIYVMLLWSTPYALPFWLTFSQAQELGGTVRKGEKGTGIDPPGPQDQIETTPAAATAFCSTHIEPPIPQLQ